MLINEFLDTSHTAFHAVNNVKKMLLEAGFDEINLYSGFVPEKGGKYFVTKNDSAIIAFRVGNGERPVLKIVESHTDSPALKVKGKKLIDCPEGKRIDTEVYGGLVLYSMIDIPLKIAGRLLVKENGKVVSKLYESDFFVNVPGLAIHHNPGVNENCSFNAQTDMLPLLGTSGDDLYAELTDAEVLDADLFVVPAVKSTRTGRNNEFLASPRIDNLTSVYTSICAIIDSDSPDIEICACFDNEEIGSYTKQGARSALLGDIIAALGLSNSDLAYAKEYGFILSVDNGHAVHPAHPEKSDPLNKVTLNGGIVIKHHTNYSTDGVSSAILKNILLTNDVLFQEYYNRSDLRCGSTIGLMSSAAYAMNACDIGLAQLAMHSAIETVGYNDIALMEKCINAFYLADLT